MTSYPTWRDHKRQSGREYFAHLMIVTGWNLARAARIAGIGRTHMYRLLQRFGLSRPVGSKSAHRGRWQELGL